MRKLLLTAFLFLGVCSLGMSQTNTAFKVRIENISRVNRFFASNLFNTPVGATMPGAIGPGGAYEFTFSAAPGHKLSFVTMFVPSNDLFFAPDEDGIALYNENGDPVSGDVTDQVMLWDAGTEANEEPGEGPNQVQRQAMPNTGPADPDNTVRLVNDGFTYPAITDVIKVTIDASSAPSFTVRIENVSTATTLMPPNVSPQPVPLSPGVWVVHTDPGPLFTSGQPDRGEGLEAIAEDGNPTGLAAMLDADTGLNVLFSPGVWTVHTEAAQLFTPGQPDYGEGLEAIAEDGNPGTLAMNLPNRSGVVSSAAFATPAGADAPGAIASGAAYEFIFTAQPGDSFSFSTMFVPSNDLIIAPGAEGVPLFNSDGTPFSGTIDTGLDIWDVGTELNGEPGIGPNQVQNQPAPNTGDPDPDNTVRIVNDGFTYPAIDDIIRVTITPLETTSFYVTIVNVSTSETLKPSDGSSQFVPLSPGVWAVHTQASPFFTPGQPDFGEGLEAIAEDGDPTMLAGILSAKAGIVSSGAFNTPAGASMPGALLPGQAYEFKIDAVPGSRLSFATMFVASNDLFFAPDENGLPLWDDAGNPLAANFTAATQLWDAGTEANEEPGVGPNQAQRQSAPNTGPPDSDNTVRLVNDGFTYPAIAEVLRVVVTPEKLQPITVRIENVSTGTTLMPSDGSNQPVPLSPGVWTVHTEAAPLFTSGAADRGEGLEAIAEDGNPGMLSGNLALQMSAITSGFFNTPVGATGPGAIGPGGFYEFTVWAFPGASLAFATMFVPSNDLFFGPDEEGIPLFDENDMMVTGDVTDQLQLWDAGTEANEEPGIGPNQVQRQSAPNTGPADPDATVRPVNDGFTYPAITEVIRVTLNAVPTGVDDEISDIVPDSYELRQNYPNPFNPGTSISYTLARDGNVRVAIYNLLGQKIRDLVNATQQAGTHRVAWDGRNDLGQEVTSGVYLYRLETAEFSTVRKMTLLR